MMHILVTTKTKPYDREAFAQAAPDAIFRYKDYYDKFDVTREDVLWADIILGNVEASHLKGATNVKWLQTASAGVEPYLACDVLAPEAPLTNGSGAYGLAISEHMLGMLLSIYKKLELYRDAQHKQQWKSLGSVRSIYGATVVILGLGDIGSEFARRCKALGAYVIGVRRSNVDKPEYIDEICLIEELNSLLPRADVLAITLPGTTETRGLIGADALRLIKDEAVILNVGRGYIIDTDALCDALNSGKLLGAGLDVTEPEPLPAGHPLWEIPTALITPHISGFYHLDETGNRINRIFLENLKRYLAGEPLINQVNRETGY